MKFAWSAWMCVCVQVCEYVVVSLYISEYRLFILQGDNGDRIYILNMQHIKGAIFNIYYIVNFKLGGTWWLYMITIVYMAFIDRSKWFAWDRVCMWRSCIAISKQASWFALWPYRNLLWAVCVHSWRLSLAFPDLGHLYLRSARQSQWNAKTAPVYKIQIYRF